MSYTPPNGPSPIALGEDVNGSGGNTDIFKDIYGFEVMKAFYQANKFLDKTSVRTIKHGKSASFPVTWKTSASYFSKGDVLYGRHDQDQTEVTINLDDRLISDIVVDELEEMKLHYDMRAPRSEAQGNALSEAMDENILRTILNTARASANFTGSAATDRVLQDTSADTVAANLRHLLKDAAQSMDQYNIPRGDRYCMLAVPQYYLLLEDGVIANRDYQGADQASASLPDYATFTIDWSNAFDALDNTSSATAGENNTYFGNFSATVGSCFHKTAAGTVKLMDLSMSIDWIPEWQAWLFAAKYAVGHGPLRPESAYELATADNS